MRKLKHWCLLAIIILIVIGILGCGGEEDEPRLSEDQVTTQKNEKSMESKEENVPEFFGIGQTVETKKIKAIITEMTKSTGSDFNKPEEGKEFVLLHMTIENISDEELNISSMLSFDAYVDDETINESLSAQMEANKTMDGTIAAGKRLTGVLGYEVPKDWGEMEIHFEPDVWADIKIRWLIKNE